MSIYEYYATVSSAGGSNASTTLKVRGGLLQQVLVRANTASTVFRVNLVDDNTVTRLNYGYHTGELNDTGIGGALPMPMEGQYTVNITNASPNDTFTIILAIQE